MTPVSPANGSLVEELIAAVLASAGAAGPVSFENDDTLSESCGTR